MKKITKTAKILLQILGGFSLIGVSSGIVLGISAATFKIEYIDLNQIYPSADSSYWKNMSSYQATTPIKSNWNCTLPEPTNAGSYLDTKAPIDWRTNWQTRYNYSCEVLDGSGHQARDQSFNQSVYNGMVNYVNGAPVASNELAEPSNNTQKSGLVYKPAQDNSVGFTATYNEAVKHGCKVINSPGFAHVTPIDSLKIGTKEDGRTLFADNIYENAGFILIDGTVSNMENVASVNFRLDESAFFSAVATCAYLVQNYDIYGKDGQLTAATFGGSNIPTVIVAMGGFQRGLQFWNSIILPEYYKANKDALNLTKDWSAYTVECIDLGNESSFFTGSFVTGEGRGISQQLLNRGADAIFPVSGSQIIDVTQEIQNQKSPCIAIGVDTSCEYGDSQRKSAFVDRSGNDDVIKFSAVKNMTKVVDQMLQLSSENLSYDASLPESDRIYTFGYQTCANSFNGGVTISRDGWKYVFDAFKVFQTSPVSPSFKDAWDVAAAKTNPTYSYEKVNGADFVLKDEAELDIVFEITCNAINSMKFDGLAKEGVTENTNLFDWIQNNMYFNF